MTKVLGHEIRLSLRFEILTFSGNVPDHKLILDCVGEYLKFNRDLMNVIDYITFTIRLTTI